jgi:7-keto-8-aminopelargonate synthetase-like enzyme
MSICWGATAAYHEDAQCLVHRFRPPRGTERVRLTPAPLHSDHDITCLVDALQDVCRTLELNMGVPAV